jgi:hypothetical protein
MSTYSAVSSLEHVELLLSLGELVLGDLRLQDVLDVLPELLVLFIEENHETGRLRVEGRGNVLDGLGDNLLDTVVGDGEFIGEGVDGAAVARGVEEAHAGGHFGCRVWTRRRDGKSSGCCMCRGGTGASYKRGSCCLERGMDVGLLV